jgi:hypothetical protein
MLAMELLVNLPAKRRDRRGKPPGFLDEDVKRGEGEDQEEH